MQDGNTALIWASYEGHVEVVKALVAAGADKGAKEKVGGEAICIAEVQGQHGLDSGRLEVGVACMHSECGSSVVITQGLVRWLRYSGTIRLSCWLRTRATSRWSKLCRLSPELMSNPRATMSVGVKVMGDGKGVVTIFPKTIEPY